MEASRDGSHRQKHRRCQHNAQQLPVVDLEAALLLQAVDSASPHQTEKSVQSLERSTILPFSSNSTPSSFNSCSFFSVLIPLGAFCHSP